MIKCNFGDMLHALINDVLPFKENNVKIKLRERFPDPSLPISCLDSVLDLFLYHVYFYRMTGNIHHLFRWLMNSVDDHLILTTASYILKTHTCIYYTSLTGKFIQYAKSFVSNTSLKVCHKTSAITYRSVYYV